VDDDVSLVTKGEDRIFGDFVVVDFAAGTAYSSGGVGFQHEGSNDGDFAFDFDGFEYSGFPTALATNFLAPNETISAELILFTLDGKPGDPPAQRFDLFDVNDDEDLTDVRGIEWDCFAILDFVQDLDFGLQEVYLGSEVGHLEILPRTAVAGLHDGPIKGDGSGDRQSVFHGWLVQRLSEGTEALGYPYSRVSGNAAFSRTLTGSGVSQTGLGSDTPSFDLESNSGSPD
jgi:hypothetical protein